MKGFIEFIREQGVTGLAQKNTICFQYETYEPDSAFCLLLNNCVFDHL